MGVHDGAGGRLSRRALLAATGAAAAGMATGSPAFALGGRPPRGFPAGVRLRRTTYVNWARTIEVPGLWTATPATPADVLRIVRWADRQGWRVRPRGAMHGWSPLVVPAGAGRRSRVVLLDTSRLTGVARVAEDRFRVGAGTRILPLLSALQAAGRGLASFPATGDPTLGGALAIGAHGAALPGRGEVVDPATSFGSFADLVTELTAVVRDGRRWRLRRFTREDADTAAFLVHLGRALVVDVVLRAGPERPLRCTSRVDVPARAVFAPTGGLFERELERTGRAEAIWFPFTEEPWLKTWEPADVQPAGTRRVDAPFNYPFSDTLPEPVERAAAQLGHRAGPGTRAFGHVQLAAVKAGLPACDAEDLWGASKDTGLYVRSSTLRVDQLGYAVLCRRADAPRVLQEIATQHAERLEAWAARGRFPVNCPVELRCCGVDAGPGDPAALAATAPVPGRPDWDVVVWFNVLALTGTDGFFAFCRETEQWLLRTYDGGRALARPEWSKGWAFTDEGPHRDRVVLRRELPARTHRFAWAAACLAEHDPDGVLSNDVLDDLLAA